VYAIIMAVDGAPQIFYEDLFNIGYLGNRFVHSPANDSTLPTRSDLENLLWCHQNLRFKEGPYLVRWQAPDALVIERGGKALVAVNDHWTQWQNLTGVQTNWPDGTILADYSGATATTRTVYGGGKVNIAIPPCNGSAPQGRRGYCVWAPVGTSTNYQRPAKRITQEWEMDDDLGDGDGRSLQQGGRTPDSSTMCRVVGRVFAASGQPIEVEVYPGGDTSFSLTLVLLDKDCQPLDSVSGAGSLFFNHVPSSSGWYTLRIRNTTANQPGQKSWVKVSYQAPQLVQTNVMKNKCACPNTSTGTAVAEWSHAANLLVYPNPAHDQLWIRANEATQPLIAYRLRDMQGRLLQASRFNQDGIEQYINLADLPTGLYLLEVMQGEVWRVSRFMKK
jgi:alpha-amylase